MNGKAVPAEMSADPQAAAGRPAFRLLRYFSAASLVIILLATVSLTGLQQRLAVQDLIHAQEKHHVLLTRSVANGHWDEFSGLFAAASSLDAVALRNHPEVARLQQLVQREFSGTQVLKVKVYAMNGRTVFSSDSRQIGEDKSGNAGFLKARDGQPASELTHRDEFSAFEQTISNVDVFASYVPVLSRASGAGIEAVFEIYSDITPLLTQIRNTRIAVALQVTGVLLALYFALFMIVRHADRVIRAQQAQRQLDGERLLAARQALAQSEKFHRALIENSSDAVMLLGPDLRVKYSAPANARVLGVSESQLVGMVLQEYAAEPSRDAVGRWLADVAATPGRVARVEFVAEHRDLGSRHFMATASNLRDQPGVAGIIVNIQDFTERRLGELEVQRRAQFDGLTGLARREHFIQQMHRILIRAARNQEVVALMYLDLDGFKAVNDSLGHETGDRLLKEVGARIRLALRQDDEVGRITFDGNGDSNPVARLGGDEFSVLLTDLDHPASAGLVAERIIAAVAAPYVFGEVTARVTTSIGIAVYDRNNLDCDELVRQADAAMYCAKQRGKNTHSFYGQPQAASPPGLSLVRRQSRRLPPGSP